MADRVDIEERVVLGLDDLPIRVIAAGMSLELEVVLDHDEELTWALWWWNGDRLLAVFAAPTA
jgi:hypothetical protein